MVSAWNVRRSLELTALSNETARRGNSGYYNSGRVDLELRDIEERAQGLYRACTEVWEAYGFRKSRPFLNAVIEHCLDPLLGTRQGSIQSELLLRDVRIGRPGASDSAIAALARKLPVLRSEWSTKFEIEARDIEIRELATRLSAPTLDDKPSIDDVASVVGNSVTEADHRAVTRKRRSREKPACYETALNVVRSDKDIAPLAFCKKMDSKAAQYPAEPKYKPPSSWRADTFFIQHRKRPNTVSSFLSRLRRKACEEAL